MKSFLRCVGLILLMLAFHSGVAAKTLKIATIAPAGTTWMNEMLRGADAIKQRTDGRVKLKFYPGGVMGNDQSVHRKIRIGQLHGGAFTPGGLAQVHSTVQSLGLPLLFNSFAEVDYVRERMDPLIKQAMESSGFVVLGISEGGFARILSKEPMRDLETIRQSKVWIPEGDRLNQVLFEALGINPISLPISDVYTGLQTGLIETVTVNPTGAIAFQWHSSTGYMTEVPLSYLIGVLAIKKKAFDKLDTGDQAIVCEEMGKVFKRMDKLNRDDNEAARAALQNQGIVFVEPDPVELQRWRRISEKSIESMIESGLISREIVSQVREFLQNFRDRQ